MLKPNDICIVFMNPLDAQKVAKENPDSISCMVVSDLIPPGDAIITKRDEFLDWLFDPENEDREYHCSDTKEEN